MGCGSSTAVSVEPSNKKLANNKKRKNRPPTPAPKWIAFEVKLDDEKSVSDSFKNRLPRRLQRLQEEHLNNGITSEEIALRQKLAEKRRKSAIAAKVLKSKEFQSKVLAANNCSENSFKDGLDSCNKSKGSLKAKTENASKKKGK